MREAEVKVAGKEAVATAVVVAAGTAAAVAVAARVAARVVAATGVVPVEAWGEAERVVAVKAAALGWRRWWRRRVAAKRLRRQRWRR